MVKNKRFKQLGRLTLGIGGLGVAAGVTGGLAARAGVGSSVGAVTSSFGTVASIAGPAIGASIALGAVKDLQPRRRKKRK